MSLTRAGRIPGGGTGRFSVMRICPSGPAGIAVMGNAARCGLDAMPAVHLVPA